MDNPHIRFLQQRQSCIRLEEPAPDRSLLEALYRAAMRAPDHARLKPLRLIVVEGEARARLGKVFETARREEEPDLSQADQERCRQMPLRAPMILVFVARIQEHPKVPEVEQMMAAACGTYAVILGLEAAGFGSVWRTGPMAYDPQVLKGLGLAEDERLVGFVYAGSLKCESKPRGQDIPPFDERVQWLDPEAD